MLVAAGGALGQPQGPTRQPGLGPCATPHPAPGPEGFYTTNVWPGGTVYYTFHAQVTQAERQQMLGAWAIISSVANVQFVPWSGEPNYILVQYSTIANTSFSSSIGMALAPQTLNITPSHWSAPGWLMHETLHALGLYHEHQRADRDTFVELHPSVANTSNYWIINNPPVPQTLNIDGPYDFSSLMHYRGAVLSDDRTITVREPWRRAWQWGIGTASFPQATLSNGDRWALYTLYPGPIAPSPRAFALLSPTSAALVGTGWVPQFTWQASEGATGYRLQVDDSPAFDSPMISVDLPATQTSYSHSGPLTPQRLYWWRATASNAVGETESYPFRSSNFYTASGFPMILCVDDTAPVGGDGTSWETALRDLGAATEIAYASDAAVTQIRVAQGVYTPDFGSGDRTLSFYLSEGCEVRGGYAGYGAPQPDARDIDAYETILSGDLNADDGPGFTNISDNSHHVVVSAFNPPSTLLEGFTIRSANSNLRPDVLAMGGGIVVDAGAPTIRRCRLVGNHADAGGGGLAVMYSDADPWIEECAFQANRAGGASTPGGGGIAVLHGLGRVINCSFVGNTANGGGAARLWGAAPQFVNTLFAANAATAFGGGAFVVTGASQPVLVNCTVVGNTAPAPSGGVRVDAGSSASISNSILWSNTPDQVTGGTTISYSNVQGGAPTGSGNISQSPLFVAAGLHAYALAAGSPGIDAGSNAAVLAGVTTDLAGNPRFMDDPCMTNTGAGTPPLVDIGAYEYRLYADCNLSGMLTIADFGCFQSKFAAGDPYADCNQSSTLTIADFGCFQSAFAAGCP